MEHAEEKNISPVSPDEQKILRGFRSRIDAGDASAHNNLGVVYFNKGMYAEAVEVLQMALEIDPQNVLARSNLEVVYRKSGYYGDEIQQA
ncbi:MAG: tetratricopeptide repeat protein, partial [Candidatus Edwardsbacteria bacterium]|nr:tetratricopeptide repeat protein [Candidatus Edwardsbacteria bacterium]